MRNLKRLIATCFAMLSLQATAAPELLPLNPSELQKMELESLL